MFKLHSDYKPTGNQPKAIKYLSNGIQEGKKFHDKISKCLFYRISFPNVFPPHSDFSYILF